MKNLSDFQRTLIMFIVSAITLVSIIFFWEFDAPEFLININKTVALITTFLAIILTFGSMVFLMCSIILFITIMCCEIANKRLEKKYISKVHVIKNSLSKEPSIVKLKNPEDSTLIDGIPNKNIDIWAHLDEDDNIILEIQVKSHTLKSIDYDWFLGNFDF